MPEFTSNKGAVLLAVARLIQDVQPPGLDEEEVQVRERWLDGNDSPYRGASVVDMGETYNAGVIGAQDVGYLCGLLFVNHRQGDSTLYSDKIQTWFERVRRRLTDQRLSVTIDNSTAPREHIPLVQSGRELTDPKKYPTYLIRQLVVAVWLRELPTNPQL